MKFKINRKKILFILMATMVFIFPIGIALGYIVNIISGWNSQIKVGEIRFLLNDEKIGNEKTINLDKLIIGDMYNLDLEAKVDSNASTGAVKYNLAFQAEGELTRAIEVYLLQEDQMVYQCMLDQFISNSLSDFLGPRDAKTYNYRLVLSRGAGDEYYVGKNVTLTVSATAEILSSNNPECPYYYISSGSDLYNLSKQLDISNRTIVFMSDIEIEDNILFTTKVGIDLNGHILNLNNHTITFQWADGYVENQVMGIYNRYSYTSTITNYIKKTPNTAENTAKIILNIQNDFMYIDEKLYNDYQFIEYGKTGTLYNFSANAFNKELLRQLVISTSKTYRKVNNDIIDFSKNLNYYFMNSSIAGIGATGENANILEYGRRGAGKFTIDPAYDDVITRIITVQFSTSINGTASSFSGSFKFLGTSNASLAQYYLSLIPNNIKSSYFLSTYDTLTKTNLNWRSSNPLLFSKAGIYLPQGIDVLSSWQDQTIYIGVTLDQNGEQLFLDKEITIEVYNAKERTDKTFTHEQLLISKDNPDIDLLNDTYELNEVELQKYIDLIAANKAGLLSINITFKDQSQEAKNNYLGDKKYIEIIDGIDCDTIHLLNIPNKISETLILTIEFTYSNNGETISYSLDKTLTIVGIQPAADAKDPTPFLLRDFTNNPYMSGDSYVYYVKAYTESGVMVDYEIKDSNAQKFMKIENGIFTTITTNEWATDGALGYYLKLDNGEYVYISNLPKYMESSDTLIAHDGSDKDIYVIIGGKEYNLTQLAKQGKVATRQAKVTISPALVPNYNVDVAITAYLLEDDGTRINEPSYRLHQQIKGIYHNKVGEIPDYNLYLALLEVFDTNSDGYITVEEAQQTMNQVRPNRLLTTTVLGTTYQYLNLSNLDIQSIKGLEYFINISGLNLSLNSIIDLTSLQDFYKMQYLDLSLNLIASLDSLQLLDGLEVLKLNNTSGNSRNNITDVSPIQYLPNVRYLDLSYNEYLTSIEGLEKYSKLTYLNILQGGLGYLRNEYNMYYILLIYDQASKISTPQFYVNNTTQLWTPNNGAIVAALALANLYTIDEVYTSLNVPGVYSYKGTLYHLLWSSTNTDLISFNSDPTNKYTTGYVIHNPVIDRNITISVKVTSDTYNPASPFSRAFNIKLLQAQSSDFTPRIQIGNVFYLASQVLPDPKLRDLIFQYLNTVQDDSLVVGSTYLEKYTITNYERAERVLDIVLPFENAGIKNLTGIENFSAIIKLNLRGNKIVLDANGDPDLTPLGKLDSLRELSLSGQLYNFTHLSSFIENENNKGTGVASGLRGLTRLDVSGCYGLDEESILAQLYQVYLANINISIYLTSSSIWNPYTIPLAKYNKGILSYIDFLELNSEVSIFANGTELRAYVEYDNTLNRYYFMFRFYDVLSIKFEIDRNGGSYGAPVDNGILGNGANQTIIFRNTVNSGYFPVNPSNTFVLSATTTGIKYTKLASYSETSYIYYNVYGNEKTGRNYINFTHYTEIFTEAPYYLNIEYYVDNNGNPYDLMGDYFTIGTLIRKSIIEIFPGRDVLNYVVSIINTLPIKTTYTLSEIINNAQIVHTTNYKTLNLYSMQVNSKYSNPLTGLYLLKCITRLGIYRDISLDTGYELQNLEYLNIVNSGVDLSILRYDLNKLIVFKVGRRVDIPNSNATFDQLITQTNLTTEDSFVGVPYCILFDPKVDDSILYTDKNYYYLNYLPNLVTLELIGTNIYDWHGLNAYTNSNTIKNLSIFGKETKDITGYKCKNYNNATKTTAQIVDNVRKNSSYYIAEVNDNTTYFIGTLQNPDLNPAITNTNLDINHPDRFRGVEDFGKLATKPEEIKREELNAVRKEYEEFAPFIKDLGVKLNDTYHYMTNDQLLKNGDSLTLPKSTFFMYGTTDGEGFAWRNFAIEWKLYAVGAPSLYSKLLGTNIIGSYGDGIREYSFDNPLLRNEILIINSVEWDVYFYFIGTIGNGYYTDVNCNTYQDGYLGNQYKFVYPVIIKGTSSYASESEVNNNNLLSNAGLTFNTLRSLNGNYSKQSFAYIGSINSLIYGQYTNIAASNQYTPITFSYLAFEDLTFRFIMFICLSKMNINGGSSYNYAIPGAILYSNQANYSSGAIDGVRNISSLSVNVDYFILNGSEFNFPSYSFVNFAYNSYTSQGNQQITSLNGCQIFTKLSSVLINENDVANTYRGQLIYSLKGLEVHYKGNLLEGGTKGLITLKVVSCLLYDLDALKSLDCLQTVDFSRNIIRTISTGIGSDGKPSSFFDNSASTLTYLNLYWNLQMCTADVEALYHLYNLTTIGLQMTTACREKGSIYGFKNAFDFWKTKGRSGTNGVAISFSANLDTKTINDWLIELNNGIAYIETGISPTGPDISALIKGTEMNTAFTLPTNIVSVVANGSAVYISGGYVQSSSLLGRTKVTFQFALSSMFGHIAVDYYVNFGSKETTSNTAFAVYNGATLIRIVEADAFDVNMYAHLLGLFSNTTIIDGRTYRLVNSKFQLYIPTDLSIVSLRGLDKLYWLASMDFGSNSVKYFNWVYEASYPGSKLPYLYSIRFGNGTILQTKDAYQAFLVAGSPLSYIDFASLTGLDYTEETIDPTLLSIAGSKTSIAKIFAATPSLKTLRINNEYNYFEVYYKNVSQTAEEDYRTNLTANNLEHFKDNPKFFNTDVDVSRFTTLDILMVYDPFSGNMWAANWEFNYNYCIKRYYLNNPSLSNYTWINNSNVSSRFNEYFITSVNGAYRDTNSYNFITRMTDYESTVVGNEYIRQILPRANEDIGFNIGDGASYSYITPAYYMLYGNQVNVTYSYNFRLTESSADLYLNIPGISIIDGNGNIVIDSDSAVTILNTIKAATGADTNIYYIRFNVWCGSAYYEFKLRINIVPTEIKEVMPPSNYILEYCLEINGTLVPTIDYFPSTRFIHWLYNVAPGNSSLAKLNNGNPYYLSTLSNEKDGYPIGTKYISKTVIDSMYFMRLTPSGTSMNAMVTTIEGIQLFSNLKEIHLGRGLITSIEPLAQMRLISFTCDLQIFYDSYDALEFKDNANHVRPMHNVIFDWSPLYNSKDTLEVFSYAFNNSYVGSRQYTSTLGLLDLTFLKMFTKISHIYIQEGDRQGNSGVNYNRYLPAFSTFAAWMQLYRNLQVFQVSGINYLGYTDDIRSDTKKAATVFNSFTGTNAIEYKNNFELVFKNGNQSYQLPININVGGEFFDLSWTSLSGHVSIGSSNILTFNYLNANNNDMIYLIAQVNIDNYYYDMFFSARLSQI